MNNTRLTKKGQRCLVELLLNNRTKPYGTKHMRFVLDNYRTQSYALAMQDLHQRTILIFRFLCGRLL
jgi:hypothetical protein